MRKKWKRVLSVILTAVFTIVLCQIQVSADTYTADNADTELEIGEYLDYLGKMAWDMKNPETGMNMRKTVIIQASNP